MPIWFLNMNSTLNMFGKIAALNIYILHLTDNIREMYLGFIALCHSTACNCFCVVSMENVKCIVDAPFPQQLA